MIDQKSITESLLAGLAQDSAQPDGADERFARRAHAVTDEDRFFAPPDDDDDDDDGDD